MTKKHEKKKCVRGNIKKKIERKTLCVCLHDMGSDIVQKEHQTSNGCIRSNLA